MEVRERTLNRRPRRFPASRNDDDFAANDKGGTVCALPKEWVQKNGTKRKYREKRRRKSTSSSALCDDRGETSIGGCFHWKRLYTAVLTLRCACCRSPRAPLKYFIFCPRPPYRRILFKRIPPPHRTEHKRISSGPQCPMFSCMPGGRMRQTPQWVGVSTTECRSDR